MTEPAIEFDTTVLTDDQEAWLRRVVRGGHCTEVALVAAGADGWKGFLLSYDDGVVLELGICASGEASIVKQVH
jgi:hypothetical protein